MNREKVIQMTNAIVTKENIENVLDAFISVKYSDLGIVITVNKDELTVLYSGVHKYLKDMQELTTEPLHINDYEEALTGYLQLNLAKYVMGDLAGTITGFIDTTVK